MSWFARFSHWLFPRPIEHLGKTRVVELSPELTALTQRLTTLADDLARDREEGLRELRSARDAVAGLLPALEQARAELARGVEAANRLKNEPVDLIGEYDRMINARG